jgi:hypothetical protein
MVCFDRLHYVFVRRMCECQPIYSLCRLGSSGKYRYEERSLGIFEAPLGEIKEDLAKLPSRERVGRYVSWHLRRQLSIGVYFPHFYRNHPISRGNL